MTSLVNLALMLHRIDRSDFTHRDIVVLFTVKSMPASTGFDVARALGFTIRSPIQGSLERLEKGGLIEDRRTSPKPTASNIWYITPAGEAHLQHALKVEE